MCLRSIILKPQFGFDTDHVIEYQGLFPRLQGLIRNSEIPNGTFRNIRYFTTRTQSVSWSTKTDKHIAHLRLIRL
ncbi:hypothetical protein SNE40_011938 [Patella caerulea]|uniref:Uncharacterized protein n=1 Tax=Patella caerulea TaxID=87958 RepID=A0AAN8PKD1_PATCE